MRKMCFVLAVMLVFVLCFASVGAAARPTLPPHARANHRCPLVVTEPEIVLMGIMVPPVEI